MVFEPDPKAYASLAGNLSINSSERWFKRANIDNVAISAQNANVRIGNRSAVGDSTSSSLFFNEPNSWTAKGINLIEFMHKENIGSDRLHLKIDIEGGEYALLPNIKSILQRDDVSFQMSLHPHFLRESLIAKHSFMSFRLLRIGNLVLRLIVCLYQLRLLNAFSKKPVMTEDNKHISIFSATLDALIFGNFLKSICSK